MLQSRLYLLKRNKMHDELNGKRYGETKCSKSKLKPLHFDNARLSYSVKRTLPDKQPSDKPQPLHRPNVNVNGGRPSTNLLAKADKRAIVNNGNKPPNSINRLSTWIANPMFPMNSMSSR